MIYKFESNGDYLEATISNYQKTNLILTIHSKESYQRIALNKEQLYDLIGALHSIQAKIKNGGKNV